MKTSIMALLLLLGLAFNVKAQCSASFIVYNDSTLPVKTIELKNFYTGYSTTVYNPSFPWDFGERETGVYVLTVTFDQPQEGSIAIREDGILYWCSYQWQLPWKYNWPVSRCKQQVIRLLPDISCRE